MNRVDDAVLRDHPPEGAGVRRADRLALVEHARAAVQQRRVDDVGMADDPADVGGRPEDLAGRDAVNGSTSTISGRPCGRRCRARRPSACRSCRRCRGRRAGPSRRRARRRPAGPLRLAASTASRQSRSRPGTQGRVGLRPLQDEAGRGLCRGKGDRAVEQRLVGDDAFGLEAAGRGQDRLRPRVVDAGRQLLRGEAAEDDRVDRADAGAGQHGEDRLRDHRHVEDDAVALLDAEILQHGGERRDLVLQLGVGDARASCR